MPWCDACDVFVAEEDMAEDQDCPECESDLDTADLKERPPVKAPWHFWLMVIAAAGYLVWRLIEGLGWALENWL